MLPRPVTSLSVPAVLLPVCLPGAGEAPGTQWAPEPDGSSDPAPRGEGGCPGLVRGSSGTAPASGWAFSLHMQAWVFRVVPHPGRAGAVEQRGFSWGMRQEGVAGYKQGGEVYPSTSIATSEGEAAVLGVRNSQLRLSDRGTGIYILDLAMYKTTTAAKANQGAEICLIEK